MNLLARSELNFTLSSPTSRTQLEDFVKSLERNISASLRQSVAGSVEPYTILNGLSGCALFFGYAFKKYKEQALLDRSFELIEECIDHISEVEQPSLYQGFTGIAWAIRHLVEQGIYDPTSLETLNEIDTHIEKTIDVFSQHNYYSLMYGLIGHGVYFAESYRNQQGVSGNGTDPQKALAKIISEIADSSVRVGSGITWHDNTSLDYHREKKVIFNLGIPHGISGIVSFLSEMIELGIEVGKCKELLFGSLTWMLNQKSNFDGVSFYPSLIVDKEPKKITRLSWAYGDLCSSYALIQGIKHLGSGPWEAEARETVEITKKRDIQNSLIHVNPIDGQVNPGICTGSSGIVLMYMKINEYFNDQSITDLINFWISKNLNHQVGSQRDKLKIFTIDENKNVFWKTDTGFLEGLSGVGLTYLSLLDEDLGSWKRLLLL